MINPSLFSIQSSVVQAHLSVEMHPSLRLIPRWTRLNLDFRWQLPDTGGTVLETPNNKRQPTPSAWIFCA